MNVGDRALDTGEKPAPPNGRCFLLSFNDPKNSEKQMNSTVKNCMKIWSLTGLWILGVISPVAVRAEMVPDFTLTDVNLTSSSYDQPVSPRDYLGQVSGWYFGHAT